VQVTWSRSVGCSQCDLLPSITCIAGYSEICKSRGSGQCYASWWNPHEDAGTFSVGGSVKILKGSTSQLCKDGYVVFLEHKRCHRVIDLGHLKTSRLNLCSCSSSSPGSSLWRESADLCVSGVLSSISTLRWCFSFQKNHWRDFVRTALITSSSVFGFIVWWTPGI